MLFPDKYKSACLYIEPDYPYIHRELAKHGVTLTLLLEEYRRKCYDESKKPYIACALGNAACRRLKKVAYIRLPELLDEITIARSRGKMKKLQATYRKFDLLILDEWLMDEHKQREMDKMNDMFGMQYSISVENQPYPVLCTLSADGCTAHVPDFPKIEVQTPTLDVALFEVKQQIQKALRQYKNPPIPTRQEQIVVPQNSVLVLVKAS